MSIFWAIYNMRSTIWAYRVPAIACMFGLIFGFWSGKIVGHFQGYNDGKLNMKTEMLLKAAQIQEVKNEIRNNRPDDDVLIARLHAGTF